MKFFFHKRFNKLDIGNTVINKNNDFLLVTRKINVNGLDSYELTNSNNGKTYCVYRNGQSIISYLSRKGYDIPIFNHVKMLSSQGEKYANN